MHHILLHTYNATITLLIYVFTIKMQNKPQIYLQFFKKIGKNSENCDP